jgi:hypothetical protein
MTVSRRYLAFSLRTHFILLTALSVWLGVVVNRAREQREAVKAIKALGGGILYDWQLEYTRAGELVNTDKDAPDGPAWLRRVIGDDFFQHVYFVVFQIIPSTPDADIMKAVPALKRLRGLSILGLPSSTSDETRHRIATALPNCEVFIIAK